MSVAIPALGNKCLRRCVTNFRTLSALLSQCQVVPILKSKLIKLDNPLQNDTT